MLCIIRTNPDPRTWFHMPHIPTGGLIMQSQSHKLYKIVKIGAKMWNCPAAWIKEALVRASCGQAVVFGATLPLVPAQQTSGDHRSQPALLSPPTPLVLINIIHCRINNQFTAKPSNEWQNENGGFKTSNWINDIYNDYKYYMLVHKNTTGAWSNKKF